MFVSDKSAVSGFVMGVIVLVCVGSGLSFLSSKRIKSSNETQTTAAKIAINAEEILSLQSHIEKTQARIDQELTPQLEESAKIAPLQGKLSTQAARIDELKTQISAATSSIEATQTSARAYRDAYRAKVREGAVGEKVASLSTRAGRTYENVLITEVSAKGLTIRHESGLVRFQPSDLDPKWTERFQWSQEEQQPSAPAGSPAPKEETVSNPKSIASPKAKSPADKEKDKQEAAEIKSEIEKRRKAVTDTLHLWDVARERVTDTIGQKSLTKSRSAPGSLKTWDQQIAEYQAKADACQKRFEAAQASLKEISPRDAVLQLKPKDPL